MKKTLGAIAPLLIVAAVALTACSPTTTTSVAEKCGGADAGIVVQGDGIAYTGTDDTTGDAYECLIKELIPEEADQDAILATLESGTGGPQTGTFGDIALVWNSTPEEGIWLAFDPK
ncbi:hypothetical protein [Microbacterium terricola]|uniref:hypothetical protein n=1 Tax=Microbacterium terricola TaxID=344163 RepID=UPI0021E8964F|nr:hypothetical protein [Microbacterium terricola]UYK41058.1 hypothetical protein OAU46_05275 [Microbacterium terricola]